MMYQDDFGSAAEPRQFIKQRLLERQQQPGLHFITAPKRGYLCNSSWGRSWCVHVESFSLWQGASRSGRSLLRGGHLYNLNFAGEKLLASLCCERDYEVEIRALPPEEECLQQLEQRILGSACLAELLQGHIGQTLLDELGALGLFPQWHELRFSCNCDDWGDVCSHVAAAMYAAAVVIENNPQLYFNWRGIDVAKLAKASLQQHNNSSQDDAWLAQVFNIEIA